MEEEISDISDVSSFSELSKTSDITLNEDLWIY
jgi:hypothetical protein